MGGRSGVPVVAATMKDASWTPVGADDAYQYSVAALSVFWPEAEHRKLIARWPWLAAEMGATWDEHRQQVERHCALIARAGHAVNHVSGDVSGLEAFLQDRRVTDPSPQDLHSSPTKVTPVVRCASSQMTRSNLGKPACCAAATVEMDW